MQANNNISMAYEAIKEAILLQHLQPGTWLTEQSLCNTLALGRSTIRNALQLLATEGFITLTPNKGARIVSFTREQLSGLLSVKTALEKYALSESITSYTEEDYAYLEDIVQHEQHCVEQNDFRGYLQYIASFYSFLINKVGNEYLTAVFTDLNNRYTVYLALYDSFYRVCDSKKLTSAKYHRKLVQALRQDKLSAASRTLDAISAWMISSYNFSPSHVPNRLLGGTGTL